MTKKLKEGGLSVISGPTAKMGLKKGAGLSMISTVCQKDILCENSVQVIKLGDKK